MKKNQVIVIFFALVVILSGIFYYKIVDLGEGRIDIEVGKESQKLDELNKKDESNTNKVENNKVESNKNGEKTDNVIEVKPANLDLSKCNENGRIMILMYHKFAETNPNNDEWTRTFSEFKNDLKLLYENNYRPISLTDYVEGNINVAYGMTPIILTFDDGHAGQLSFDRDESGVLVPKKNTAVAIMQEFNKEHPDFELKGTFYISSETFFGSKGKMSERLQYLVDLGFELGNRTKTGYYLGNAKSAEKVQEEVGGLAKFIDEYLPGYKIDSLSLPGGSNTKSFKNYLYKGTYEGYEYENKSVVSIYNSYAARSPIDNERDLTNLPRVKVADDTRGLEYWIEYYKEHEDEKYISDGDALTFVIDKADENLVTVDTNYEKYII